MTNGGRDSGSHHLLSASERKSAFGPCPPAGGGVHHYRFIVYALSRPVQVDSQTSPDDARSAIVDASTRDGQLVGTFTTG
ncbi:hypothetical protein [Nocardia sp. NPDC057455]|uniref:hypothetical protein n=1 Tax=Nocardia sp. NPDC057455 TaxID=3346138 RepID=UPI00366C83A9